MVLEVNVTEVPGMFLEMKPVSYSLTLFLLISYVRIDIFI